MATKKRTKNVRASRGLLDSLAKADTITQRLRELDKPPRIPTEPLTLDNFVDMRPLEIQIGAAAAQVVSLRAQHEKAQKSLTEAQAVERALSSELRDVTLEFTKLVEEFGRG